MAAKRATSATAADDGDNNDGDGPVVVNTEKASRGLWLVKVPRYLSEIWEKNSGEVVGRLVRQDNGETIFHSNHKDKTPATSTSVANAITEISQPGTSSSSSSMNGGPKTLLGELKPIGMRRPSSTAEIPLQHKFITRDVNNQSLAVLSEDKSSLEEDAEFTSGKLNIEGRIVIRAECQPPNSKDYMRMKIRQIQKVSQPKKTVQQMDRAVVKFKPVNVHQEHMVKEKARKEGSRAVRLERNEVIQLLFHAFEKHQFYRQTDLQKITNQPASIVREVLNDIGMYHDSAPHKAMWELKPEYRNYSKELAKKVDEKMQQD